jgi:hypothetical protein
MKRFVLTLCLFIAFATLNNAEAFYNCIDGEGNSMITDNPPADAICESPGGNDKSAKGENFIAIQQIIIMLNNLERKSSQGVLSRDERKQQIQLLKELSQYDTDNATRRITKILDNMGSKSIGGKLTDIENEQQMKLIQLQQSLSKRPIKSNAESRSTQNETESKTSQLQGDIGVKNDKQKTEQTQQKGEIKRLLKIPRLGD